MESKFIDILKLIGLIILMIVVYLIMDRMASSSWGLY